MGVARVARCWLVAGAYLLCHRQPRDLGHIPVPQFPLHGDLGASFPLFGLTRAHHTPPPHRRPFLLAASSGGFRGFYPSPLGVQKVSMFNSLFQTDLI